MTAVKENLIAEKGEVSSISPEDLLYKINRIEGDNEIRNKALVAFLYLTAARIEEVCCYILEIRKDVKTQKDGEIKEIMVVEERQYVGEPIKKKQIFRYGDDGKKMEVRDVRCLKRKWVSKDMPVKRNIPIYINDLEKPFVEYLDDYLKTLQEDDYLFPFTRQRGNQILGKIDLFPHILRHTRLTHLTVYYGFTPTALKQYTGWTSIRPTDTYVHLRTDDLFRTFKYGYKGR